MHIKQIKVIVLILSGFVLMLSLTIFYLRWVKIELNPIEETIYLRQGLPASPFAFAPNMYGWHNQSIFQLLATPPRLHLPDFRSYLIYYGKNGRPDAAATNPKLHFGFQGGKQLVSAISDEKIFLIFDKKLSGVCKYAFSPENQETSVWFTAIPEGNDVKIKIMMQDKTGEFALEGDVYAEFVLQEKEMVRTATQNTWEIGKWRVDGTLLARQKARWVGVDCFLERHGGEEYNEFVGKQRIDFGEAEECYSLFVKTGDSFIWEEGKWKPISTTSESFDKPLLHVKKVEDRVMMFELWDISGKNKIVLNMIRSPEAFEHKNITQDFRFIGARTKTQVVFQLNQARLIVKPHDWLVLTSEGWRKLNKPEEIDDYVNRRLIGPLFVFEEIAKKDDHPVVIGTIFNSSRTDMHTIEIAMIPSSATVGSPLEKQDNSLDEDRAQAVTPVAAH